jgi:hypothetical protein
VSDGSGPKPDGSSPIEARFHAEVVALVAIERAQARPGEPAVDLEVDK